MVKICASGVIARGEQRVTVPRMIVMVIACTVFALGNIRVSAANAKFKHKDLNRLAKGLRSVRESAKKARTRLIALKRREIVLLEKIDDAKAQETPDSYDDAQITIDSANEELAKIRFERQALQKKVRTCELNQKCILAEIEVVTDDGTSTAEDDSDIEFVRPVPGRITSGFGPRIHPIEGTDKPHQGLDLAGAIGDPVKCSANGKVIFAGVQRGYGKIIIVQHSDELSSAYGHLSQINVQVGELVAQDQKIGEVGMTGNSTGPHLHFEIRVNGDQVDPTKYL